MIITISGEPGAGKTTAGKLLAKKLGYEFISAGEIRRRLAKERGWDIHKLNEIGEIQDWTDREVDEYIRKLGETRDNIIVESRIAYHFIPQSVKIYLKVDPRVGAKRIVNSGRADEKYPDLEEAVKRLQERVKSDARRYKKYYGIDFPDFRKFDLILDTTNLGIEEVLERILDFLKVDTSHK